MVYCELQHKRTRHWRLKEDLRENIRRCVSKIRPNQLEPMSTGHNSLPPLNHIASLWRSMRTNQRRWSAQNWTLSFATISGYKWVAQGAMHKWIYVHTFCRGSCDLAFPDKILQGVWGECQPRNLWIFLKQTSTRASLIKITDLICNS